MKVDFVNQSVTLSFAEVAKFQKHQQSALNSAAEIAEIDDSNAFLQIACAAESVGVDLVLPEIEKAVEDELPELDPDLEPGDVSLGEINAA